MRRLVTLLSGAMLIALAGCGDSSGKRTADSTSAVVLPSPSATAAINSGGATGQTGTSRPGGSPAPNGAATGARFRAEGRSTSSWLKSLEFVLRGAERTSDALTLEVGFANTSDEPINVAGALSGRDATLTGADATDQKPKAVSDSLRSGIEPEAQGFVPGAASIGTLTFPPQSGTSPFTLNLRTFTPISFSLTTPEARPSELAIPTGEFAVGAAARGTRDALARIEMRANKVVVQGDGVDVDLSFINTSRQGYALISGPQGGNARLLDGNHVPIAPTIVPDAFKSSIAPKDGWGPGGEYRATLRFPAPKPGPVRELRLVFSSFDTIVLAFSERGFSGARVTSPGGGAPRAAPAPSAEDAAVAAIEAVLARQTEALTKKDEAAYLAQVAPAYVGEARTLFRRLTSLPLKDVALKLAPEARIPDPSKPTLDNVAVEVSFGFSGVPDDSDFLYSLDYDFARSGTGWQVAGARAERNPPFWLTGDVAVREARRFLILSRPDAVKDLPTFEADAERAYQTLLDRGLPLESRFVAFYTADQSDFAKLVGNGSSRLLGAALSRYTFTGDTVTTRSRAFYINGAAFVNARRQVAVDRQTTVTHELVHLALAKETRPYTPPWLAEGMAEYYSGRSTPEIRKRLAEDTTLDGLTLESLTKAESLGEYDLLGTQVDAQYAYSGQTVAYLATTFGEGKVLEFYRSYTAVSAASVREKLPRFGGSYAADAAFSDLRLQLTNAAVQRSFGQSLAQLDASAKAWVRR